MAQKPRLGFRPPVSKLNAPPFVTLHGAGTGVGSPGPQTGSCKASLMLMQPLTFLGPILENGGRYLHFRVLREKPEQTLYLFESLMRDLEEILALRDGDRRKRAGN